MNKAKMELAKVTAKKVRTTSDPADYAVFSRAVDALTDEELTLTADELAQVGGGRMWAPVMS